MIVRVPDGERPAGSRSGVADRTHLEQCPYQHRSAVADGPDEGLGSLRVENPAIGLIGGVGGMKLMAVDAVQVVAGGDGDSRVAVTGDSRHYFLVQTLGFLGLIRGGFPILPVRQQDARSRGFTKVVASIAALEGTERRTEAAMRTSSSTTSTRAVVIATSLPRRCVRTMCSSSH